MSLSLPLYRATCFYSSISLCAFLPFGKEPNEEEAKKTFKYLEEIGELGELEDVEDYLPEKDEQ